MKKFFKSFLIVFVLSTIFSHSIWSGSICTKPKDEDLVENHNESRRRNEKPKNNSKSVTDKSVKKFHAKTRRNSNSSSHDKVSPQSLEELDVKANGGHSHSSNSIDKKSQLEKDRAEKIKTPFERGRGVKAASAKKKEQLNLNPASFSKKSDPELTSEQIKEKTPLAVKSSTDTIDRKEKRGKKKNIKKNIKKKNAAIAVKKAQAVKEKDLSQQEESKNSSRVESTSESDTKEKTGDNKEEFYIRKVDSAIYKNYKKEEITKDKKNKNNIMQSSLVQLTSSQNDGIITITAENDNKEAESEKKRVTAANVTKQETLPYTENTRELTNGLIYDSDEEMYYYSTPGLSEQSPPMPEYRTYKPSPNSEQIALFTLDETKQAFPHKSKFSWLTGSAHESEKKELVNKNLLNKEHFSPLLVHGCLMASDDGRVYLGSGILIYMQDKSNVNDKGEIYILTAAHNVLKKSRSRMTEVMSFYPGMISFDPNTQFEETAPICLKGKGAAISKDYMDDGENTRDLALIKFQQLPELLNWKIYDIPTFSEEEVEKGKKEKLKEINVTGYPARPPFDGRHMVQTVCQVSYAKEGRLYYDGKTRAGQSGAGAWVKEQLSGGEKYSLVAIHTHGDEDEGTGSATLLTQENLERIKKWREELDKFCQ